MSLYDIRLELARCEGFPEGSKLIGYEFVAPLDQAGHFDPVDWERNKALCRVRRFWSGHEVESGLLIHAGRRVWAFSYDPATESDDEPVFRFDRHVFRMGEYVSIMEHDGVERPYRVALIRPHSVTAGAATAD